MSNTRYAPAGADPDAAPERYLASAKVRGINIGLNVVCRVARCRPEPERRAMIWLANYARHRELTADALSEELDLDKAEIRAALTDPDADLARFCREVARVRQGFEAGLPPWVDTAPFKKVRAAFDFARDERVIAEVVGHTRMGKTDAAKDRYLHHLDRAVWLDCPSDESDRTFVFDLARALGIGVGTGKKAVQVKPQVKACFGPGLIDLLIVDEAHFLWPADAKCKPKRIEFLRCDIHNNGRVGVLVLATPQFTASLQASMNSNPRWAPGQWDGRRVPFYLKDTMSEADLTAVARHHAPEFPEEHLALLVEQAKASAGFCGVMINAIKYARALARAEGEPVVTRARLEDAQAQMARGTRLEQLAREQAARAKPAARPAAAPNGHPRPRALTPPPTHATGATARF